MELDEWMQIYQALSATAGAKERSYWTIAGIFLMANCLIIFPLSLFLFSYRIAEGRLFTTVIAAIGIIISLGWSFNQRRLLLEVNHFSSLLRGIEGQFAGAEFHRSLDRLIAGEEVCVQSTSWKCKEWHPEVTRLGRATRLMPHASIAIIPIVFLLAWVALGVVSWIF